MTVTKLAVTGYPGWLTTALFDRLRDGGDGTPQELVLLAHPATLEAAREGARTYPWPTDVIAYDLAHPGSIADSLRGVDTLVHTAALIHVKRTRDWYDVNTAGTLALARDAKRAGVRRFVYISSIAAAGKSRRGRVLREDDPSRPAHHYGRSKLRAERGLFALQEPGVFDVVILRPSMFYGPPVPQRHVEIYQRVRDSWMPLVGGGNYDRSMVHIDNLVQAVRRAMVVDEAAGRTYFVVDRPVYTTRQVTDAMAAALGTTARYVPLPAVLAEVAYQADRALSTLGAYVAPVHLLGEAHWNQAASCDRAIAELGYRPDVELGAGMREAIAWCRASGRL
jgi:UDP-glucose 4-epimerase